MKNLDLSEFETIDIKKNNISETDLELAGKTVDSYIDLFNKRARKIKELGLDLNSSSEQELFNHILSEYSFLKRPMLIDGAKVLAGNSKAIIAEMEKEYGNA